MPTYRWIPPIALAAVAATGLILDLPSWSDTDAAVASLFWFLAIGASLKLGLGSLRTAALTGAILVVLAAPPVFAGEVGEDYLPVESVSPTNPLTLVIQKGDNFWTIARGLLRDRIGHQPAGADIKGYWVELVGANRETIRSGDPDLIYPGEVVRLP